jgi:hypothetical protein
LERPGGTAIQALQACLWRAPAAENSYDVLRQQRVGILKHFARSEDVVDLVDDGPEARRPLRQTCLPPGTGDRLLDQTSMLNIERRKAFTESRIILELGIGHPPNGAAHRRFTRGAGALFASLANRASSGISASTVLASQSAHNQHHECRVPFAVFWSIVLFFILANKNAS